MVNHRNITRVTDVYVNVLPGYDVGSVVHKIEAGLEQLGARPVTDERGSLYRIGYYTDQDVEQGNVTATTSNRSSMGSRATASATSSV